MWSAGSAPTGHDGLVEGSAGRSGPGLVVVAALRIEALALGRPVVVVGMGPQRAAHGGARLAERLPAQAPVVVAGVCGALDDALRPGTVLVPDRVSGPGGTLVELPGAAAMAEALAALGHQPVVVPLRSVDRVARGEERRRLAAGGARAVDMETATLVEHLAGHPLCVVRTVADTPAVGVVRGGIAGLRALRRLRPAFVAWAATVT